MLKHILLISSLLVSGGVCAEKGHWVPLTSTESVLVYWNPALTEVVRGSKSKEVDFWLKVVNVEEYYYTSQVAVNYSLIKQRMQCVDYSNKTVEIVKYLKNKKSTSTQNQSL